MNARQIFAELDKEIADLIRVRTALVTSYRNRSTRMHRALNAATQKRKRWAKARKQTKAQR